jgi:hypothetical protein
MICATEMRGVLLANRSIDPTQDNWYPRKVLLDQPDSLLHPWIPIGHGGCDQDHVRLGSVEKTLLENSRSNSKSPKTPLNLIQSWRFRYLHAVILAGAKAAPSGRLDTFHFFQPRIMNIQTVQQPQSIAMGP